MDRPIKLNVNSEILADCVKKINVEIPAEMVNEELNKVACKYQSKARIPGFRQGKAPMAIIQKQFGEAVQAEATDNLLNSAVRDALKELALDGETVTRPSLMNESELKMAVKDTALSFSVKVETKPEITLPEYKGLQLTKEVKIISEDDVQKQLDNLVEMCVQYEKTEEASARNDMLICDFQAQLPEDIKVEDKNNYFIKAEKTWLPLREPERLPGTSTALIGLKAGDKKDIEIAFPEDFTLEVLRGKTIPYHFEISEVRRETLPEINEDFCKRFGAKDLDALKATLKRRLEYQAESEQQDNLQKQISNLIFANMSFALPPSILEENVAKSFQMLLNKEKRAGADKDALAAKTDELKKQAQEETEKALRETYMLQAIMKAENVTFEQEDYKKMLGYMQMSNPNKNFRALLEEKQKSGEIDEFIQTTLITKTFDKIIEKANVVETTPAVK